MAIEFGREVCGDLRIAESREWLVTNGIGGYASGTVAGLLTRQYHGILIAAIAPPTRRRLLLAKLDETALYRGQVYPLYTNRWADGTIAPQGYRHIEQFRLEGTTPVWTYACGEAALEKRVWMEPGRNTTYVRYALLRGERSLELSVKALVNDRSHHGGAAAEDWQIEPCENGLQLQAFEGASPLYLLCDGLGDGSGNGTGRGGTIAERYTWYSGFDLAMERSRGTGECEDHLHVATLKLRLEPGAAVTVVASTTARPTMGRDGFEAARSRRERYERELLRGWLSTPGLQTEGAPGWIQQLVLAADSFVVRRSRSDGGGSETTLLAGYPWFGDWGRYGAMSLPGLTLATGRPQVAREILQTYARYVRNGQLPNVFPDEGGEPAYNTADATLWYVEAVRLYWAATGDRGFLAQVFPTLVSAVDGYSSGGVLGVTLDRKDGLLRTAARLTWMDAQVGGIDVTPRAGKAIEINALWYNAAIALGEFAEVLGQPSKPYLALARQIQAGFQRFWNSSTGYCYDVLDGSNGDDPRLRPNQLLAVSLPGQLLSLERQRAVVSACGRSLVTSYGLRSLSPEDAHYRSHYVGNIMQRDLAYHQGTVWAWWLGIYAIALLRVSERPEVARSVLAPVAHHLSAAGLGQVGELFDGDPPFAPRGCLAHGAAVASVLWARLTAAQFRETT